MVQKRPFLLHALSGLSHLRCKSTMTSRCRMSPSGRRWRDRRMWLDHDNGSGRHRSCKFIQQRLRVLQVRRIETLSKPVIDRTEQITGFHALALVAPEPRKAGAGAQRKQLRTLALRACDRAAIASLGGEL